MPLQRSHSTFCNRHCHGGWDSPLQCWTLVFALAFTSIGCRSNQPMPDRVANSIKVPSEINDRTNLASAVRLGIPTATQQAGVEHHVYNDHVESAPTNSHDPFGGKRDTQRLIELASAKQSGQLDIATPAMPSSVPPSDASQPPEFWDLTEAEMITLALQNSDVIRSLGVRVLEAPASVTTAYDTAIQATDPMFGPQAALAEFDSQLSASLNTQNNDRVFNNATLGGQVQELVQDYAQFQSGWTKRNTWGTQWDVQSIHQYDSNNRAGNSFPSYWETQLELGVRQPLLQGAGRTFNLIAGPNARPGLNFSNGIWIARINSQISQADFEIQLRDYFLELYTAYWQLQRLYHSYASIRQARDVSYEIWQTVLSKKQSGLIGGEAYKEAQTRAQYYRYQREADLALGGSEGETGIRNAERTLRRMIGLPIADGKLLRPADGFTVAPFEFAIDDSVARGFQHRTELRRQRLQVQQHNLRLVAAKNFLRPRLDMIGRTRVRGFGDDLTGDGPRFSSAADDFFSFDHTEWEFGVEMGVAPLRRQAKAAVRNAKLQLHRERSILEEQQHAVTFEIHDAISNSQSSFAALQNSLARVEAGQDRLASSRALYDAGKIQLEFLIDATEELLHSQRQLHVDQTNYSLSLVRISRAMGTLLSDVGVHSYRR
ncbi:TolC family protein [Rhodopirellula europaea]|uniref:Outer membrane efflux protein n=1 Tax=Rhodopirellula europaea SH398 TaxID=1263868 RepID=M5SS39_9BACT|nr:TolC family protein [Rhodopirellula europaea]EMI29094.1 outer membrane efflux protein [Rhodopirellula europaea SH398]